MSDSEEKKPLFDIKTPDDLLDMMSIIDGKDPKQVQTMSRFIDVDSVDETSYYPTRLTSIAIAQLRMYGQAFYRGEDWNEYDTCADLLGTGFKGLKGWKSDQYKDITSGQINLDKLKDVPEDTKKSILSGIFRRGGSE
jgi:hypothetical protein